MHSLIYSFIHLSIVRWPPCKRIKVNSANKSTESLSDEAPLFIPLSIGTPPKRSCSSKHKVCTSDSITETLPSLENTALADDSSRERLFTVTQEQKSLVVPFLNPKQLEEFDSFDEPMDLVVDTVPSCGHSSKYPIVIEDSEEEDCPSQLAPEKEKELSLKKVGLPKCVTDGEITLLSTNMILPDNSLKSNLEEFETPITKCPIQSDHTKLSFEKTVQSSVSRDLPSAEYQKLPSATISRWNSKFPKVVAPEPSSSSGIANRPSSTEVVALSTLMTTTACPAISESKKKAKGNGP